MRKLGWGNRILDEFATSCPDITLTWDWGDYELQIDIHEEKVTYFLADCINTEFILQGDITDIEPIRNIIEAQGEINKR